MPDRHPLLARHTRHTRHTRMLASAAAWMATTLATPGVQATPLNTQLLVNGDAESGSTAGWASTGIDAVASGLAGSAGLPVGVSLGSFSFTGGTGNAASQSLMQTVQLDDIAGQIDAAQVAVDFSALIQSRRDADTTDTAKATLRFLDAGGAVIAGFDFFDAEVPLNNNAWSFVSLAQGLPTGTRAMQVLLDVRRSGGASSDGYFDNVWLSVSAVPEPGTWGLMALGLAAVVARSRPGRRPLAARTHSKPGSQVASEGKTPTTSMPSRNSPTNGHAAAKSSVIGTSLRAPLKANMA